LKVKAIFFMNRIISCLLRSDFQVSRMLCVQSYAYCITESGIIHLSFVDDAVIAASFVAAMAHEYRTIAEPDVNNILLIGTDFQLRVWQAVVQIPAGKTCSYQELAITIGQPQSWRAVARALAINPVAYFIPCHRVIHKNGSIGGYKWGAGLKRRLLDTEF
jgi:AraC family transcriptional regulator, regulatory protein of adaptative response / methylated-DNA-[protein]-cysteine methyltransferase